MATNKPLQTILNDLPDNNAKEITPADVRQIATSSFSPQLVLAAYQSRIFTSPTNVPAYAKTIYHCNYYNPYFFAPQSPTTADLNQTDQIWQITNYGTGLTPGLGQTAICKANPIVGYETTGFATPTDGVWEVDIDANGQLINFKIISPAQGWLSGSLPSNFPSVFEQTGYLDINGNQTIKVKFNGPLRALTYANGDESTYEMTTNPNSSDPSTTFPGQGSQAAANFNSVNSSSNIALVLPFTGTTPLYGIRVGQLSDTGSGQTDFADNILMTKRDADACTQFQIWRTPGGNF